MYSLVINILLLQESRRSSKSCISLAKSIRMRNYLLCSMFSTREASFLYKTKTNTLFLEKKINLTVKESERILKIKNKLITKVCCPVELQDLMIEVPDRGWNLYKDKNDPGFKCIDLGARIKSNMGKIKSILVSCINFILKIIFLKTHKSITSTK